MTDHPTESHSLVRFFGCNIHAKTLRLNLTLIRPIVTYGAETWAATENELQKLLTFERKILRKMLQKKKNIHAMYV
jgi:hypothetical protein